MCINLAEKSLSMAHGKEGKLHDNYGGISVQCPYKVQFITIYFMAQFNY